MSAGQLPKPWSDQFKLTVKVVKTPDKLMEASADSLASKEAFKSSVVVHWAKDWDGRISHAQRAVATRSRREFILNSLDGELNKKTPHDP